MRAAVRRRYGAPDVVRIAEAPKPSIKKNELLVRVHATTVNRTDCAARAADPFFWRFLTGFFRPRLTILGNEFVGEVAETGDDVTLFRVGDRVFGLSDAAFGAHAEYLSIPQDGMLALMPEGLDYDQAAPSTEGAYYALTMIKGAGIREGQDILVYGATGAIGSAAVQLVKSLGAGVTAVCATESLELVRGLGADRVVDYTTEDFTADKQRYDVVMDAVGKSTFGRCKRLLKPSGIYIASELGPGWQNLFLALVTPLLGGRKVRFPIPRPDPGIPQYLKTLIESGEFTPVIDRRYPLDDIVEAYRYVETGKKIGNVVILVDPADRPAQS
ncbi:NAD(P)-dependent alcohol dehydrogenase [Rhizohabitans arisaemae]|uniref:NAD(P)-dependent alcohol dehydrogenase n=1 Tax=Rhizohabitans arisaemae TaxID=2720610 RepID=UPI0024B214B8|nr:NAD(P)-dependent alcohol dehydrogenase [Rhizohabitans arisaemae]